MEHHPLVVIGHPLASKTRAEVKEIATLIVDQIAIGLLKNQ
jgi:hypothetical protein